MIYKYIDNIYEKKCNILYIYNNIYIYIRDIQFYFDIHMYTRYMI